MAGTLGQEFGCSDDTWWVVSSVAAAVVVFVLGYFGIRLSTGAGTLLGLFEILAFAALAVTLIVQAGEANTLAVFGTGFAVDVVKGMATPWPGWRAAPTAACASWAATTWPARADQALRWR